MAGQVVVGSATADVVRDELALDSLGRLELRGKGEPVEAFAVADGAQERLTE